MEISTKTLCWTKDNPVRFCLAWPPSANHMWKKARNGVLYLTPEAVQYKKLAAYAYYNEHLPYLEGLIAVRMYIFRPDLRRRDIENFMKVPLDALKTVAFEDDSQIAELHVYRQLDRKNPRIEVALWNLVESV